MLFESAFPARALFDPCLLPLGLWDPDLTFGVTTAATATTPDVYAWFPGEPIMPGRGRRYEEYAHEEPKKKRRRVIRTPKAKQAPIVPVEYPLPLAPPPMVEPPAILQPQPLAMLPVRPRSVVAEPVIQQPDWTQYAHLPIDPNDEEDELQMLLHVLNS